MAKGETKGEMQREGVKGVKVSGLSVKDSIANRTDSVYSSTMVVLASGAGYGTHSFTCWCRAITIDYD